MTIQRIHSGGAFEAKIGYCRAVVAGGFVYVAGTVGQGDSVTEQCKSALSVIGDALEKAGSSFEKVVRVTYYLPDRAEFEPCWPILAEAFGDSRIGLGRIAAMFGEQDFGPLSLAFTTAFEAMLFVTMVVAAIRLLPDRHGNRTPAGDVGRYAGSV